MRIWLLLPSVLKSSVSLGETIHVATLRLGWNLLNEVALFRSRGALAGLEALALACFRELALAFDQLALA